MQNSLGVFLILGLATLPCPASLNEIPDIVATSSSYTGEFLPNSAVDGDLTTRWASAAKNDGEWLQIDFGTSISLGDLRLVWEHAYARAYELQASQDVIVWETLFEEKNGTGAEQVVHGNRTQTRFIRLLCHAVGPFDLYSLWEMEFLDEENQKVLEARQAAVEQARQTEGRAALGATLSDAGIREIVYAVRPMYEDGHWYANISYFAQDKNRKAYARGGGLYVLNVEDGTVHTLIEDPEGTVRDPAVHYDGKTILFSWRKGGEESFHLYTINRDGSGLVQITDGTYDDFEPAWLPDGGIVFVSTRCRRWVNCWLTQVATLHRCNGDGSNLRSLSGNLEQDNTPWPLPDGRILYTRWEYVDRSQVDYHHLWSMNPNGSAQMTYFGNMHPPDLYIDAKPVPGTEDVVFINSPGHGAREHAGMVALVNIKQGPDHLPSLQNISKNGYRDPYPINANAFLAARQYKLVLLDRYGQEITLHRIRPGARRDELHEPRPLVARQREPLIPSHTREGMDTGRLILAAAHVGRNMEGVAPGEIAKLLVVESLPKPINYTGGMDPLSYGGTFTLERILGEVPVEPDGSASFDVPSERSLFFIAMDKDNQAIKRMQSFLSVMPGETLGCVGCHEERTKAPENPGRFQLMALNRPPSAITPLANLPEVFDFPRDIQPILDKHCLKCHDYIAHEGAGHGPRAGGVILSGDHGPMFSHSYAALTVFGQVADGRNRAVSNYPPRALGAAASPLMHKIDSSHHGVKLDEKEKDTVRYWIETGAPYPGTYGALGAGCIGGYAENTQVNTDNEWPEAIAVRAMIEKRCLQCHQGERQIPLNLSDENGLSFWQPDWSDPRLKRSRHLAFNLSRPELSLMLLAPLAPEAGGYGHCIGNEVSYQPEFPFQSTHDPGYQAILALCQKGMEKLAEMKRFDMQGYQPPQPYIREMIRYGILPENHDWNTPVDCYVLDRAYWDSFK